MLQSYYRQIRSLALTYKIDIRGTRYSQYCIPKDLAIRRDNVRIQSSQVINLGAELSKV
jgi:hypothetical protein